MSAGEWMPAVVLDEMQARIDYLEEENAALWAYARACIDLFESPPDGPTGIGVSPTQRILTARKALRQWEDNDE